jgi:hypothetical protein
MHLGEIEISRFAEDGSSNPQIGSRCQFREGNGSGKVKYEFTAASWLQASFPDRPEVEVSLNLSRFETAPRVKESTVQHYSSVTLKTIKSGVRFERRHHIRPGDSMTRQ